MFILLAFAKQTLFSQKRSGVDLLVFINETKE